MADKDSLSIIERLAAQDPAEKEHRNRLIAEGVPVRTAVIRAAQRSGRVRTGTAVRRQQLATEIAGAQAELREVTKAVRKARKAAAARHAAETARDARLGALVDAKVREALVPLRLVESVASGTGEGAKALRESGNRDLAAIAAAAMYGPGPVAETRPGSAVPGSGALLESIAAGAPGTSEMLRKAPLEDLAALASAATPRPAARRSPFWRMGDSDG